MFARVSLEGNGPCIDNGVQDMTCNRIVLRVVMFVRLKCLARFCIGTRSVGVVCLPDLVAGEANHVLTNVAAAILPASRHQVDAHAI